MSENLNNNLSEQVTENTVETQPKIKKMLGLKISTAILCALATIFVLWLYIDLAISINNAEGWEGLGIAFVLVIMVPLAIIGFTVPFILGLVGMIMAIVRFCKKKTSLATMIYFIAFTAFNLLGLLFAIFGLRIIT